MYQRTLKTYLQAQFQKMPMIGMTGPRQSGKTTLIKACFPDLPYVLFEDLDVQAFAREDPRAFLQQYAGGAIFDEVQRVPHLFSYLQGMVDTTDKVGQFVLSGSQNFLLIEKINQSLAGRITLLHLLPMSYAELCAAGVNGRSIESIIFKGFYPRVHRFDLEPNGWYPSYIQTYIERDVRQIKNIVDLSLFRKFLYLCAGRVGHILNVTSLANDCGITHNTARAWISLLESSFIVFLLKPYHQNFGKQTIKSPKLYFYDTGVVCSLLGLEISQQIKTHYLRGALFENFIIAELMKRTYHTGRRPRLYFWRDKGGHEIDCLIDKGGELIPVEIKAGQTVCSDYFKGIRYWQAHQTVKTPAYVIYGGDIVQKRTDATVLPWSTYLEDVENSIGSGLSH